MSILTMRPFASSMTVSSILFPGADGIPGAEPERDPPFFGDLHLDAIADKLFAGRDAYNLRPFFRFALRTTEAITYRQEAMRDFERCDVLAEITAFAESMRVTREARAQSARLSYACERERWTLDAANVYCDCVERISKALIELPIASRGLHAFRDYLVSYLQSADYRMLVEGLVSAREELAAISYAVSIDGDLLSVRDPSGERDLVAAIHDTFARFRKSDAKSYLLASREHPGMNHIEAKVLEFVALLHPGAFAKLSAFEREHGDFTDAVIERFDREVQFYIASIEYARFFEAAGLPMCFPQVDLGRMVFAEETFDAALAQRLIDGGAEVVQNNFALKGKERVFVVSGPNQGGKTTFARTFGQLHYLAALGCRVPGGRVTVGVFDAMFTHFERQEDPAALRGKLEDDLMRIHDILKCATPQSIIILNEIFATTTVRDATDLAERIMNRILELDARCLC
ncbi:MAG TPA: hypothetical protein VF741_03310, partial [Candidatus Aquilonibacter sp.]